MSLLNYIGLIKSAKIVEAPESSFVADDELKANKLGLLFPDFSEKFELLKSLNFSGPQKPELHSFIQIIQLKPTIKDGKVIIEEVPIEYKEYRLLLTRLNISNEERVQISKSWGDEEEFITTFGKEPMVWTFDGYLKNQDTHMGNWSGAFQYSFQNRWRAAVLVKNQQFIRIGISDYDIDGYMLGLNINVDSSSDDVVVPITFKVLVRRYSSRKRNLESYRKILKNFSETTGIKEGEAYDGGSSVFLPPEWRSYSNVVPVRPSTEKLGEDPQSILYKASREKNNKK